MNQTHMLFNRWFGSDIVAALRHLKYQWIIQVWLRCCSCFRSGMTELQAHTLECTLLFMRLLTLRCARCCWGGWSTESSDSKANPHNDHGEDKALCDLGQTQIPFVKMQCQVLTTITEIWTFDTGQWHLMLMKCNARHQGEHIETTSLSYIESIALWVSASRQRQIRVQEKWWACN